MAYGEENKEKDKAERVKAPVKKTGASSLKEGFKLIFNSYEDVVGPANNSFSKIRDAAFVSGMGAKFYNHSDVRNIVKSDSSSTLSSFIPKSRLYNPLRAPLIILSTLRNSTYKLCDMGLSPLWENTRNKWSDSGYIGKALLTLPAIIGSLLHFVLKPTIKLVATLGIGICEIPSEILSKTSDQLLKHAIIPAVKFLDNLAGNPRIPIPEVVTNSIDYFLAKTGLDNLGLFQNNTPADTNLGKIKRKVYEGEDEDDDEDLTDGESLDEDESDYGDDDYFGYEDEALTDRDSFYDELDNAQDIKFQQNVTDFLSAPPPPPPVDGRPYGPSVVIDPTYHQQFKDAVHLKNPNYEKPTQPNNTEPKPKPDYTPSPGPGR